MTITINKPIYANYVGIRSKYVEEAIRNGEPLIITIPEGTGVHDPRKWKETSKVIYKEFKIPGNPMKLFCNYVKIDKQTDEQKAMEFSRNCL